MYRRVELRYREFQPAAVGNTETKALFTVTAGTRVVFASARCEIPAAASTQTTVELGDGVDPDGFIAPIDTETATAGGLTNGAGALLNQSGGKLYTADDTVDVVYTVTSGGATNPKFTFCIGTVRDW